MWGLRRPEKTLRSYHHKLFSHGGQGFFAFSTCSGMFSSLSHDASVFLQKPPNMFFIHSCSDGVNLKRHRVQRLSVTALRRLSFFTFEHGFRRAHGYEASRRVRTAASIEGVHVQ